MFYIAVSLSRPLGGAGLQACRKGLELEGASAPEVMAAAQPVPQRLKPSMEGHRMQR